MESFKICRKCGEEKLLHEYYLRKDRGYKSQCKGCMKKYRDQHKDKIKEYQKKYFQENKNKIKEYRKQYCQRNKEKINTYYRNKYQNDENYKIANNIRSRLGSALKSKNIEKSYHTFNLIGCSINELKSWLEFTKIFYLPQNYEGKLHIDHFKPISKFNLNDEQQLKQACHYTNLRYLTEEENLKKSNKSPTSSDLDKMNFMKNIFNDKFQVCKCFDE